jgi:hypothetical protein
VVHRDAGRCGGRRSGGWHGVAPRDTAGHVSEVVGFASGQDRAPTQLLACPGRGG